MDAISDIADRLHHAVSHRYRIVRELGRGGMAIVFLAHDLKHGRRVALKALKPEVAQGVGVERFLREILIAARLTHPNILPLHDSDVADGLPYFVMPLIEGESLRDRLKREKQLPIEVAVAVLREIADALHHAHQAGVLHRDVKPENIMFTAGHAVLSDFGIARAIEASGSRALTETGLVIGTPAYMSPEQASGDVELDSRSDIYSLGCVAYEMLAGQPPFGGPTAMAILARHYMDPVPPLRTLRPGVPDDLQEIILRALAKAPADRFATAAEFGEALARPAKSAPPARSIAVLPFVDLASEAGNEWFADGVTEDVIAQLSKIHALKVISRTSVMAFKKRDIGVREIARQLRVATVLEGSVRRAGDRVRVVAQLIDAATDRHLWAETYDRQLTDIFAIQSDLATRITEALRAELLPQERERLRSHGSPANAPHPEAYEAYLRGRFHLHQHTPEGLALALRCFEHALELDPEYTLALGAIADTWGARTHVGLVAPKEAYPVARERVLKAFELNDTLPETNDWIGRLRCWFEWDWPGAESAYRRSIALNANYPDAHMMYSVVLTVMKRWDEAAVHAERAIELDPLNPLFQWARAIQPLFRHEYEEALQQFGKILRLEPGFPIARLGLWSIMHQTRKHQDALDHLAMYFAGFGNQGLVKMLTRGSNDEGYEDTMHRAAVMLAEQYRARFLPPTLIAQMYAHGGDGDRALEWLETGYSERDFNMIFVGLHPAWDQLRSTARYTSLVRRMQFPA